MKKSDILVKGAPDGENQENSVKEKMIENQTKPGKRH